MYILSPASHKAFNGIENSNIASSLPINCYIGHCFSQRILHLGALRAHKTRRQRHRLQVGGEQFHSILRAQRAQHGSHGRERIVTIDPYLAGRGIDHDDHVDYDDGRVSCWTDKTSRVCKSYKEAEEFFNPGPDQKVTPAPVTMEDRAKPAAQVVRPDPVAMKGTNP